jgi:hypothetical protein
MPGHAFLRDLALIFSWELGDSGGDADSKVTLIYGSLQLWLGPVADSGGIGDRPLRDIEQMAAAARLIAGQFCKFAELVSRPPITMFVAAQCLPSTNAPGASMTVA